MIVVTTPTGHIGSQLARELLSAGEAVRVIARHPEKLAPEIRTRANVIEGSSADEALLMRALEGAEGFFLVVPPAFTTHSNTEHYLAFTRPACRAIAVHKVRRVVTISGIGRGVPVSAGPVTASFVKDDEIAKTGVNFRALWCPGFMENMLRQLDSLKSQNAFSSPSRADVKLPVVATRDIAAVAARLFRDRSWTGQSGQAVLGPEDLSCNDMAEILTAVLGRAIHFQPVPREPYRAQLIRFGASEEFADGLLDMYAAKDKGLDHSEPRTPENTTPTTFRQWCEEVLQPALR